ncbi:hypothetical protein [Ramlibacter sp.]|nr:hypothetical protein [Ramlibacter sp.]
MRILLIEDDKVLADALARAPGHSAHASMRRARAKRPAACSPSAR